MFFFYKAQVFAADECINSDPPPDNYGEDHVCDTWTEYGCPWGSGVNNLGKNVGRRTVKQYCSGNSADCTGTISYGDWLSITNCDDCEYCITGEIVCGSVSPPISPSDGGVGVKTPVTLDWCSAVGAQSYQLEIFEIDTDGNEQNFSTQITTKSEACIKNFSENTEYRWRVADCANDNGTDCGSFDQKWRFTTDGGITINEPTLSSPLIGTTDVQLPVTLRWSNVWNAKSYFILIYEALDFSEPVYIDVPQTNQISIGVEGCLVKGMIYAWTVAACFNDDGTRCGTGCCDNESGNECGSFPSMWGFQVTDTVILPCPELKEPFYDPTKPAPMVYPSDELRWKGICAANSYRYEINEIGRATVINDSTGSSYVGFDTLWSSLNLGTDYSWYVKSCWDSDGNQCEADWSEEWQFKTAGGTPAGLDPIDGATGTAIPVRLSWGNVAETFSYQYQVAADFGFNNIVAEGSPRSSFGFVDYPDITISTTYWWQVRSCIDSQGIVCGEWTSSRSFTTGGLNTPSQPSPSDGDTLFTYERNISWDPDPSLNPSARYYRYRIDYASKPGDERDPDCVSGQEIVPFTIVSSNFASISFDCLGEYNWWVQACLDKDCAVTGPQSDQWNFTLIQPDPPAQFGLLPCNRESDNPKTPWLEDKPCEIKHIILIFKGIVDLILWRIGMTFLIILIVATAVIFYLSLGAPATIVNIKSIWKRAGQGYAIMFLAWMIINFIVKFLGFTDKWWELPF